MRVALRATRRRGERRQQRRRVRGAVHHGDARQRRASRIRRGRHHALRSLRGLLADAGFGGLPAHGGFDHQRAAVLFRLGAHGAPAVFEHHLSTANADHVAFDQGALAHLDAVDEQAVPRAEIVQHKAVFYRPDLGMLARLCSYLNTSNGGSIDSGPVTIRDNVASSTMTTDDLSSEWTKTYGPIFTSAVSLCRELKPQEFKRLPQWLTSFIEHMELRHYTTLFGEEAASNPDVVTLFSIMQKYKDAEDRDAVLEELQQSFDKIFAS